MNSKFVFYYLALFLITKIYSDSVCDEMTLLMELEQDLADNGILDCLRVIPPPHDTVREESIEEKNKRLAA